MYEVFEHTADLGLRVRAADVDSLFVDAARGLFSLVVANLDDVRPVTVVEFALQGEDLEFLFFDWLNELLYTFESRHLLLSQFEVQIERPRLAATARGEVMDTSRHEMEHEVKAITYHGLKVEHTRDGWLAEVIIDI